MRPEAMLRVEISVPSQFEAEVVADLERRGGTVTRTDSVRVIKGSIPNVGLEEYGAELRSITAGHGTYRAYAPEPAR
jgi:translation elongation factor EF-G